MPHKKSPRGYGGNTSHKSRPEALGKSKITQDRDLYRSERCQLGCGQTYNSQQMSMSYEEIHVALTHEVRTNVSDPAAVARIFELMTLLQRGFEGSVNEAVGLRGQVESQMKQLQETSISNDRVFNDMLLNVARQQEAKFMDYNARELQQEAELRAVNALHNPFYYDMNQHIPEIMAIKATLENVKTERTIAEIERLT